MIAPKRCIPSIAAPALLLALAMVLPAAAQQSPANKSGSTLPGPADFAAKLNRAAAQTSVIPLAAGKAPVTFSLLDLMANYKVPAISVAVIDHFQIVATKAYGTVALDSTDPVTTKTLFQAGSISKPVTAAAALWMVEHGQLSLDTNVNDALKSWKVPDNEFTVTEKVTLRRLMSHSAGTNVHGFPGYEVDAPLPSVVQVLNGEKPANTEAVRVVRVPGTKYDYSGGGVTIEQLLMTDVSGKPFPSLMRELVLDKIGMTDSTFEQPLPANRASLTAIGAYVSGKSVPGKWHIYPEMAAAGLWTTPTDLATYAIEIAQSRNGKSTKILSQKMATEMLTPGLGDSGLGFFMDPKNPGTFGHSGADEGFQATLTMNYETGNGVVIMSNSDQGLFVEGQLVGAVSREFGWNYKRGEDTQTELYLLDLANGPKAALALYTDIKRANDPDREVNEQTLNSIAYRLFGNGRVTDAIPLLERNVEEYPNSFNVYDSLGEAYMRNGQKDLAIANYEKSLQIFPGNTNGAEMLKKLNEMK
jgi:CubicO group peptidase (beta-lactamase class C family)